MGILIVYNEPTTSQVRQAKSRRHGGSGHLAGGCYDLRAEKDSALGARTDNKKALTGKIEVTLLSNRRRKAMAGRVFSQRVRSPPRAQRRFFWPWLLLQRQKDGSAGTSMIGLTDSAGRWF
jgi:hypothetical protein